MPSSLIIVALVVAWLLVLVPIVARRRQEVARTADSTLAARVVRSGGVRGTVEEERTMPDAGEADTARDRTVDGDFDAELDGDLDDEFDDGLDEDESVDGDAAEYDDGYEYDDRVGVDGFADGGFSDGGHRPYRPGRGGFDAEAAALTASARYAFRQRIVVLLLLAAVGSAVAAGFVMPMLWWAHAGVDLGLVGYLAYLRRQVRIEEEIRERRTARLGAAGRRAAEQEADYDDVEQAEDEAPPVARRPVRAGVRPVVRPGTVVVDSDDEDPMFTDLEEPAGALPYRRAVGE